MCEPLTFITSFSMSSQRMGTLTLSLIFLPASSLSASTLMENQGTFSGWSLITRNLVSSQVQAVSCGGKPKCKASPAAVRPSTRCFIGKKVIGNQKKFLLWFNLTQLQSHNLQIKDLDSTKLLCYGNFPLYLQYCLV